MSAASCATARSLNLQFRFGGRLRIFGRGWKGSSELSQRFLNDFSELFEEGRFTSEAFSICDNRYEASIQEEHFNLFLFHIGGGLRFALANFHVIFYRKTRV